MDNAVLSVTMPEMVSNLAGHLLGAERAALDERAGELLLFTVKASIRLRAYRTGHMHDETYLDEMALRAVGELTVFTDVVYGPFVEDGTVRMAARQPYALGLAEAMPLVTSLVVENIIRGL